MGLFSGIKQSIRDKQAKIQEAYEDGMNHFVRGYGNNSKVSISEAMESFSYCVEVFEKNYKAGKDEAQGYLMAAKKWLSGDALSNNSAEFFLENEYDKCEDYRWRFSLTLILRPELSKRGLVYQDDMGRWIKKW